MFVQLRVNNLVFQVKKGLFILIICSLTLWQTLETVIEGYLGLKWDVDTFYLQPDPSGPYPEDPAGAGGGAEQPGEEVGGGGGGGGGGPGGGGGKTSLNSLNVILLY